MSDSLIDHLPTPIDGGLGGGDTDLFESTYTDMQRIAANCFEGERRDHTLTPTALVHEAWLRLSSRGFGSQTDRRHFFSCAARTMRRVLIDHARSRGALKRGGGCIRVPLDAVELMNSVDTEQIVALEEVVSRLEKQDAELGEIVRLRFYAGLTSEQAAEVMSLPLRTFKRRWSLARGFLTREIERAREELAHDAG